MTPPSYALSPGTVIKGHLRDYHIIKVLGQGGFGITYLTESSIINGGKEIKVKFALKEHFISSLCARDQATHRIEYSSPVAEEVNSSLRAFIKEARRLKELGVGHHNIVKIDEVFETNNTAYYAMEFLDGGTLDNHIRTRGTLDIRQTLALFKPVIAAAAILHKNKIAHYDIKPGNIMLRRDHAGSPEAVLIDFGLAKHYDSGGNATSRTNVAGYSPGYAPIQQYRGIKKFSPSYDVYAIAATIYFCLTGHAPADAFDLNTADTKRQLLPLAGQRYTDTLIAALAEKTEDRIQDATDLYDQLYNAPTNSGRQSYDKTVVINRHTGNSNRPGNIFIIITAIIVAIVIAVTIVSSNSSVDTESDTDSIPAYEYEQIAAAESEDMASDTALITEPEVSAAEKERFAAEFKHNVTFGQWEAVGEPDDNLIGDAVIYLRNRNDKAVDGSDYSIKFNYTHIYANQVMDRVTQRGKNISAGGSAKFTYQYSDDCSPDVPRVVWNLTDVQIYDKYH